MDEYHQNVCESSSVEVSQNSEKNFDTEHTEYVRRTWTKNMKTDRPKKYRPLLHTKYENHENTYRVPLRVPVMYHPPSQSDLESVIREFENNFLKPTEVDTSNNSKKNKNFVKKIVAAFEEKYKAYNEAKIEEDVRAILENRELFVKMGKPSSYSFSSKNINTFANTSKMCRPGSSKEEDDMYASFITPERKQYDQKNKWKSIWTSPFKFSTPKESKFIKIMTGKYHPEQELLSDIKDDELDEKLEEIPKKDVNLNQKLKFDNDLIHNAEMLEENDSTVCNRENDLMIEEIKMLVTSTPKQRMQNNFNESFEEEETDIDWLPPEKELSQKKSFKKLFSKLAVIKKSKKACLYQSVNKEFQDSGYDEMYLSSSPLNKSTSENSKSSCFRKKLYSSKTRSSTAKESIEEKSYYDEASGGITSTDLKPNSTDKKSTAKPMTSACHFISTMTIPKYLFDNADNSSVTITETDDTSTIELCSNSSLSSYINKNCSYLEAEELEILEKVEFPRDISRKFFSQSDTRINEIRAYNNAKQKESLEGYRKPRPRPATTSFYDDVLSLRRRMGSLPNFYSCPEHNPAYATIKRGHKCRFCDYDRQRIFDEIQPELNTSL